MTHIGPSVDALHLIAYYQMSISGVLTVHCGNLKVMIITKVGVVTYVVLSRQFGWEISS